MRLSLGSRMEFEVRAFAVNVLYGFDLTEAEREAVMGVRSSFE